MPAAPLPWSELRNWCAEEGFPRAACVQAKYLPESLRSHPWIAALGAGTYLLVALSCFRREADDLSVAGDPHGLIAPFARRNYYREAVLRLRRVAGRLAAATGSTRRELRIFCNSRLPEKFLAAASGLGAYGKNALVLAPDLGSLFVIAGMFLPAGLGECVPAPAGRSVGSPVGPPGVGTTYVPGWPCGECRACQEACPVGALPEPGRLDESRCLQAQAGRDGELSEELAGAWGFRLYGCQVCQEVCPHNRGLDVETVTSVGELGPSLPLRWFLERTTEELAAALRGTALGMSWISKRALQRNALLAAAHRVRSGFSLDPALQRLLESFRRHPDPVLGRVADRVAGGPAAPDPAEGGRERGELP